MEMYMDSGEYDKTPAQGTSDNFVFTVVDESDDSYLLEFEGNVAGLQDFGFAQAIMTKSSIYKGNLLLRKTDLSLEEFNSQLNARLFFLIGSSKIPIPIPFKIISNIAVKFSPTWKLLQFPFFDGMTSHFIPSYLYHDVRFNLFFTFIPLLEASWSYSIPIELPILCQKEEIEVEAGTYSAYHIIDKGHPEKFGSYEYYFAPEISNVIKISIFIKKAEVPEDNYYSFYMELKSTNYTP
jgi:hypothetical protein